MISWKNSFKRLNEEYDLAKKKKQAVDNLYITGKISQLTRDTFNKDITAAIAEIERQQKDLVTKMQLKTEELTSQIKLLETLLANYEIQYVIGEIGDETYQRDILLFTIGIDTAKTELDTITQATIQLCGSVQTIQAPIAPDIPVAETVIETPTTTETAAPDEFSIPIETPVDSTPLETTLFEATPAPIEKPIMESTTNAEAPIDTPVMESAIEETLTADAPLTAPVMELAIVEEPVIESAIVENALFADAPVIESAIVEAPVESLFEASNDEALKILEESLVEAPVDVLSEESVIESAIVESPVEAVDSFVPVETDDSVIEITAKDPIFLTSDISSAVEEPVMESTVNVVEEAPLESTVMDLPVEDASITLVEDQALADVADVADVPLQVFEVTEQAPVEQTLEKVLEQLNSPAVEELTHSSHPTTAPHQALSEITAEAVSDGQIDESDEDSTE
ncbi:MAG: CdvA-like protein [Candidatus Bathyarchaeota archaeon]|nr:CdvA-like protein [Candidatus Termiticorpusculum sp.]MCL1970513.1 CdvA-like protein [Candidatus Termiticorpusculum sp.]